MSEFKDYEIRQADAALRKATEGNGFLTMSECFEVMDVIGPAPQYMRMVLMKDLHLFEQVGGTMMINEEGRKAARKGLKRYLMVRDTKRKIEDTTKIGAFAKLIWAVIGAVTSSVIWLIVSTMR